MAMPRVIVQEFVSIDGFASGLKGSVDFIPASMRGDRRFGREQTKLMDSIGVMLLGRVTYAMFAGYWPSTSDNDEQPFADKFNALPKIVFSSTLQHAPWGRWPEATIVRTNPAQEVARLKEHAGKDLFVSGSLSIAQSLISAQLVDEYRLVACPIVLGEGRRLFDNVGRAIRLELGDAHSLDRGAVSLTYRRAAHEGGV
jgi:dihydrofolate reductase